jgi:hypothetical protein
MMLLVILATAQAASIPSYFRRDDVCHGRASDNLSQCPDGLDAGLCCSEGQTCVTLAGGSTVFCCPVSVCQRIKPIPCNVNLLNPAQFPNVFIKTTALKAALPKCRGNCCPFGFSCNAEGDCDMDEDQSQRPRDLPESERPSATAAPSSAIITPSIIPTTIGSRPTAAPTSTGSPASEEQQGSDDNDKKDDPMPTAIIVVSVLGGLLVIVSVAVGVVMFLARRRRKDAPSLRHMSETKHSGAGFRRPSTSTSSFGNFISEPILNQGPPLRSDFILKSPASAATRASTRLSGLFRRDGISYGGTTANNSPAAASASATKDTDKPLRSPPRFPARSLSNANMTTSKHPAIAVPPIRTLRSQQKPKISTGNAWTRHAAAARSAIHDAATPVNPVRPVTPHLQREPSSESINVFADPSTVGSSGRAGPFHLEPPRSKRFTAGTTFTDLMDQAELGDVRRGKAFVPTPGR